MNKFNSFTDYLRFVCARKFVTDDNRTFRTENKSERWGGYLVTPLLKPLNFCLQNIRNPLMVVALTVGALFMSTLIFYPASLSALAIAVPIIRLTAFTLTQATIIGLCVRTLGRLANKPLMQAWEAGSIYPVGLGSRRDL